MVGGVSRIEYPPGGAKAHYDGIAAFSQSDFTDDLTQITAPVLAMHGDDDQVVP